MRSLATNPLLLSFICYVVDDPNGVEIPTRRGEFYHRIIRRLLVRPNRVKVVYPGIEPDSSEKRLILEQVALRLFMKDEYSLTFSGNELIEELKASVISLGYDNAAAWANALREDIIKNSGILRCSDKQWYFFLHLIIQEFLAASAIARLVNRNGWNAEIELVSTKLTIIEILDKKVWDPGWQEVIILLSGRLSDPIPLLNMLRNSESTKTNPYGDDFFRHRLALSALCLSELPPYIQKKHSGIVDQITTDVFLFWWKHYEYSKYAIYNFNQVMPALGQLNGRILQKNKTPLLDFLAGMLTNPGVSWEEKGIPSFITKALNLGLPADLKNQMIQKRKINKTVKVLNTVKRIGPAAATKEILTCIAPLLTDGNEYIRKHAIEVVERFGSNSATDEILTQLANMLANLHTHNSAIHLIESIGDSTFTNSFLEQMKQLLTDDSKYVRDQVSRASINIRNTVAKTDFLLFLFSILLKDNKGKDVRETASNTMRAVGGVATSEFLNHLEQLLDNNDSLIRSTAAEVVGLISTYTKYPRFMPAITKLLSDEDEYVIHNALWALGSITNVIVAPQLHARLKLLLSNKNKYIRSAAIRVIRNSKEINNHEILAEIIPLLKDNERRVKYWALMVISHLGKSAITNEIRSSITELLDDKDSVIRRRAIWTIYGIGKEFATKEMLNKLIQLLNDDDGSVRAGAVRTLAFLDDKIILTRTTQIFGDEDIGVRRRVLEVLNDALDNVDNIDDIIASELFDHLARFLTDNLEELKFEVQELLVKIGCVKVTSDFTNLLVQLLNDDNVRVRSSAAQIIGRIGNLAAKPEIIACLARLVADTVLYHNDSTTEGGSWYEAKNAICMISDICIKMPEFRDYLRQLLAGNDWYVYYHVSMSLGEIDYTDHISDSAYPDIHYRTLFPRVD